MTQIFERTLNGLERRFGSWAVPGLIRYLAVAFIAVYLIGGILPNLGPTIDFNWEKTLSGEIWRPFTFIIASSVGKLSIIGVIFAFFGMMIMFMFSDGLEQQWGVFRTNLYVLWGWLSALVGSVIIHLLTGDAPEMPGMYLAMSIFFAFATYNPKFTIMLFMIIPTPIWILAAISGVFVGLSLLAGGLQALFTILCLSNYFIVAVPMRLSQSKQQRGSRKRNAQFRAASISDGAAFNTCAVCGATEITHPECEFRVGDDGKDYCAEHLPE
jgi:hypothetical protein